MSGKVTVSDADVEVRNLPERRVLSLIHRGEYDTIPFSRMALYEYLKKNELEEYGPALEIYLNDPSVVKPEDLLTEIQVSVRR